MGLSNTVSGDIASFRTPSRVPIESLKFHFLPKQEGSGDPSPTNVRPITGWTGLNGKRAGKNIGHIVNFSANSGQIGETAPQLSNKYGTTLNTITYSLPDTELVITQTDHDEPTETSYKNGYFAVWMDNLEYNKSYDVSLRVKNVVDPLNAGLNKLRINGPSGGSSKFPSYVDNDLIVYKNVLHAPYVNEGVTKNRKGWEFRICGMSMTIYEIMVTPADKSDGVFEPYSGSVFPVTFHTDEENKFNTTVKNGNIASNGKEISASNDRLITNGFMYLPAGMYTLSSQQNYPCAIYVYSDQDEDSYISAESLASWNNSPVVFTLTRGRYIRLKWQNNTGTRILPSDLTNIQIKLCTFYGGGYFDPIAGEIVVSWRKFKVKDYEWVYKPGNHRFQMQLANTERSSASGSWTNFAISDSYQQSQQTGYSNLMIATYSNYYIYIRDDSFETEEDFIASRGEVEIAYELVNPIHIPVAPQDLKAFLDHNNFWSDTNDITEVTYAVTESKDILATRKKAMDFDIGHRRKVKWNQIQIDGNFQDIDNWEGSSGYNALSIADGVMTCTVTSQPSQFYQTGFRTKNKVGFLQIPYNHKILVSAYLRCSVETRARIYGLIGTNGNTYIYQYNYGNVNIPANTWTRFFGFISDRPETPPSSADDVIIKRFKPCVVGKSGDMATITVGSTFDCKNLMVFDLTQMFGLGNEPQTVAEFEHICEINGIDLTTYQPYDTGSDRWLIVP